MSVSVYGGRGAGRWYIIGLNKSIFLKAFNKLKAQLALADSEP